MFTETSARTVPQEVEERVAIMADTAELIRNNALKIASAKLPPADQDLGLNELMNRHHFVDYFKHALAQEVAKTIAEYDENVQACYLFDESANADAMMEEYPANKDQTIHILALVKSVTAALEAFVLVLDRSLVEVLREMPTPVYQERKSILDVLPITENDIESGKGYAALLKSFYARPLKIWERS